MPCPSFHKLILPTTIQSRQLRIPDNFVRRYGGDLSTIATLSVHDGSVWSIGLKKADNKVWFHDNWAEFARRYSIGVGIFLVFRYEGRSSFILHIFNLAASEINYQSPTGSGNEGAYYANSLRIFEEMEDEDSIGLLESSRFTPGPLQNDVFAGSVVKLTPGRSYTPPALQNLFNGPELNAINWGDGGRALSSLDTRLARDIGVQFNATEFKKSTDELKLCASIDENFKKTPRKKRKSGPSANGQESWEWDENEEVVEIPFRCYEKASSRKRTVTAEERERAMNAAKEFEPLNPFCRVVLRPSYLYKGCILYLPSDFAEKHLNGVTGSIQIRTSDGRSWSVRCLYKGGRVKLSQGWFEFVMENNLGEGDVCVLELFRTVEVVLQATIFRVAEEHAGFLSPPLQQNKNVTPTSARMLNPYMQHRLSSNQMVRS